MLVSYTLGLRQNNKKYMHKKPDYPVRWQTL